MNSRIYNLNREGYKRGVTFSDLHLLSIYSSGKHPRYQKAIRRELKGASVCVMNGDIFDCFTFPPNLSVKKVIAEACAWINEITKEFPDCQFYYAIGNHERMKDFKSAIDLLKKECPNLRVTDKPIRLGNAVFVHGDQELGAHEKGYTTEKEGKIGLAEMLFYQIPGNMSAILSSRVLFPFKKSADKILASLSQGGGKLLEGAEHIFFGHIHRSFSDRLYKGYRFHNTGVTLYGHPHLFNMMTFDMNSEGTLENVRSYKQQGIS